MTQPVAMTERPDEPRRGHAPREPRSERAGLGPVEYLLAGLIVLGVAVTVAMAIFNPAG